MRYSPFFIRTIRVLVLSALAFALAACNPLENETQSMSYLVVDRLRGMDATGAASDYIQSDVLYEDPTTGETSIIADIATATLTVHMLDPDPIMGASPYADVELTSYTVTFTRADGRNTPGVDVPYPFEGDLTRILEVETPTNVSFVIVRESAKQESPLLDILQLNTRAEVFTATAQVDFYGHDLTGAEVKATGYISITFANYAN